VLSYSVFYFILFFFCFSFFFFTDPSTTEIYTLSLHDALPILYADRRDAGAGAQLSSSRGRRDGGAGAHLPRLKGVVQMRPGAPRSEEHTSELQSRGHLVCRLLLEKKKKKNEKTNKSHKKKQNR